MDDVALPESVQELPMTTSLWVMPGRFLPRLSLGDFSFLLRTLSGLPSPPLGSAFDGTATAAAGGGGGDGDAKGDAKDAVVAGDGAGPGNVGGTSM
jgi:hypothetical protein